jgi:ATP-dependent Clp protease adaptor protein ClpS
MAAKEKIKNKPEKKEKVQEDRFLILHNDDYHTFDYVIDALIEVCGHEFNQAVQCTMLTHYKGQCDVKKGSFTYLSPMRKALTDRELKATID